MPVTVGLLLKLRETLVDEAATDLVTWVEWSSDQDLARLRDLAELYFQRFDARLEQRLAETKAELRSEFKVELAMLRGDLGAVRIELTSQGRDLVKWMFIFWAGTVLPLAGLLIALISL